MRRRSWPRSWRQRRDCRHGLTPEQLEAAARLFNINGFASLAVLVGASLPQCYTMRTGVRILALTSQLGAHSNRRLHQTAAMVLAVMGPGAFEPRGTGIRQTQKVRLIHAAIRYRILSALGQGGIGASAGAEVTAPREGRRALGQRRDREAWIQLASSA